MSREEKTLVNDDTIDEDYIDKVFNTVVNDTPSSSDPIIPKVGEMVRKPEDYEKYYVPKVVSIGPYHHGKRELSSFQKLKPAFTMRLLQNNKDARKSLYKKLGAKEMVHDLRSYYEEKSIAMITDTEFTTIMLLDACFILYFFLFFFEGVQMDSADYTPELKSKIFFIHRDLFLLENQIPFKVLAEVMNVVPERECLKKIKLFIYGSILASGKPKGWLKSILCILRSFSPSSTPPLESKWLNRLIDTEQEADNYVPDCLLHLLHGRLTETFKVTTNYAAIPKNVRCNFQNVRELVDVGINFKPSDTMSSTRIEYIKGWLGCSANVTLPPIIVNDSTQPMLLNLMTYEARWCSSHEAWVTSYVCLLGALIDEAEDVKVLRKAWVLQTSFYSDKEIADLVSDISVDLVPDNVAYMEAKTKIQAHYESWGNTLFSQLKKEYFKSPWAIFALLGALIALLLSGVQTYYTVWSPKGTCDDLCMFLKMNHHL